MKKAQWPFGNEWVCRIWQTIPVNRIPTEIRYLTRKVVAFFTSAHRNFQAFSLLLCYINVYMYFFRAINAWPTRRLIGITCTDDCLMYRRKKTRRLLYGGSSFHFICWWNMVFCIYFLYEKGFWLIDRCVCINEGMSNCVDT